MRSPKSGCNPTRQASTIRLCRSGLILCWLFLLGIGEGWCQIVVQNMSFEADGTDFANPPQGWSQWVVSGSLEGTLAADSHPEFQTQMLDYSFAAGRVSHNTTYEGGYFQEVSAVPGHRYHCTAYVYTPVSVSGGGQARIGIDPNGGNDPNSGEIQWSNWVSSTSSWVRIGFEFEAAPIAQSTAMTVFLHLRQPTASPWNAVLFDYVAVYDVSRSPIPVDHVWGWVAPGGRLGDDRGPADQVKLMNELLYDSNEGSGVRGTWSVCEPSPGVWDWSSVDAAGVEKAPLVAKGSILFSGLWFRTTAWTPEYDTPLYWFYAERFVTEMAKRANMWGTYAWVFENEPEGKGDVSGHGARLRHAFSAVKAASVNNAVIAPNISGSGWDWYHNLYTNYSLKYSTDVIGSHQYSGDPNAGVSVGGVVSMHNIMASHGDGDKRIWLGEGWAPYAALADVFRANHNEWLNAREVEAIRRTVVNGYLNMTTNEMTPSHNPDWLWGASFFTMNDWYNKYGWRDRAVPVDENGDGEVDYYTVDGYRVGLDIDPGFNPTGLTDFRGNSKDDIMDVYPGNNLSLANPGFELEWSIESPYAWEPRTSPPPAETYIVDRSIRRHGRRSLRLQMEAVGTEYVTQRSVRYSVTSGETYTAAAWCRTWGVSGGGRGATVRLRFFNSSGAPIGSEYWSSSAPATSDWVRLTASGSAPAGSIQLEVGLVVDGAGGIAWFDDVSVNPGNDVSLATIRGVVVDDWYVSEPGATVQTVGAEYSAISDATGHFVIENVVPGTYDLAATKAGFGTEESRAQIAPAGRTRVTSFAIPELDERMPVDFKALDLKTGGTLFLTWEKPTSPHFQHVNLYTAAIPSEPGTLLAGTLTGTSHLLTGITPGERHYLSLRAVHSDIGETGPTEVVLGKTSYGKESVFYQVGGRADWSSLYTNDWGQTFTAVENYDLAYVSCMIGTAGTGMRTTYVSIHDGGPAGPQIGPTRFASMYSDETRRFYWGQGEVPLEVGRLYYVHYYSPDGGFGMYRNATNPYPGGMTYTNGSPHSDIDIWSVMAGAYPPDLEIYDVTAEPAGGGYTTIRWRTMVPGTSQVEYGTTPEHGSMSSLDSLQVRDHEVTLTGLDLDTTYHFRVHSTWNAASTEISPDYMFHTGDSPETPTPRPTSTATPTPSPTPTPGPGDNVLLNPSFELDGVSFVNPPAAWQHYSHRESADGTLKNGDLGIAFSPADGDFVAGKITDWGQPHHGFYQRVGSTPGVKYAGTVSIRTVLTSGGTPGVARLGLDPSGGTDPNSASIRWTDWYSSSVGWMPVGLSGGNAVTATGSNLTLFLELKQDALVPWNAILFDLADLRQVSELPTATPQPSFSATPTNTPPWTSTPTFTPTPTITPTPTETPFPTATPISDVDGDGIPDDLEGGMFPADHETNRYLPDSDGDGLSDGYEDANRDGQRDPGELDPRSRDSDGDGYEDGVEVKLLGTNPLDPGDPVATLVDQDGDCLPSGLDPNDALVDTDGDRFADGYEAVNSGTLAAEDPFDVPRLGDLDGNEAWDNGDAQRILNFFSFVPTAGTDARFSDLNRDGKIDNADAQISLNFYTNPDLVLPAE